MELNFTASTDKLNDKVFSDAYAIATIDVGDLKKVKNAALKAAVVAHTLAEYDNAPDIKSRNNTNYLPNHQIGLIVESAIFSQMTGAPYQTRKDVVAPVRDAAGNISSVNVAFDYGSGNVFSTSLAYPDTGKMLSDFK
jgi:hypothetical protein